MDKISVLYLTLYGAKVGGGEVQYEYLIKGLDRKRFHPIVICPSKGDLVESLLSEGIPTHILKLPRWLHVQSILTKRLAVQRIVQFAKKADINLIHSDYRMNPYMLAVSRELSIPNVVHVRSKMR
ncbi:MAG: glycosyltransferase, partial [Candidatus Poribacteria bacterium]|nr:glycosyltransferase [Candidatus Poribacteria bacterium]